LYIIGNLYAYNISKNIEKELVIQYTG